MVATQLTGTEPTPMYCRTTLTAGPAPLPGNSGGGRFESPGGKTTTTAVTDQLVQEGGGWGGRVGGVPFRGGGFQPLTRVPSHEETNNITPCQNAHEQQNTTTTISQTGLVQKKDSIFYLFIFDHSRRRLMSLRCFLFRLLTRLLTRRALAEYQESRYTPENTKGGSTPVS